MVRSVMRLGPVHVLVVAASPSLRESMTAWLRGSKRVRIARSVASSAQLDGEHLEIDLVVASGLDGPTELRRISKKVGARAGFVALSLGTTPLPAGWIPVLPGASRAHVLDHAVPHPERGLAASWTVISCLIAAAVAVTAAFLYVPEAGVSFQRAALGYAERFPAAAIWWHVWGAGGPYLATASWPLIKSAAALGGGTAPSFVLLGAAMAAVFTTALVLLTTRIGAGRYAIALALAAIALPALWTWPRGGDIASLAGLSGTLLALAAAGNARLRLPTIALGVAVSSFGGYLWVVPAALAGIAVGVGARRARPAVAGAFLGFLMSTAIALPPVLYRGLDGVRPSLARTPALSDLVPVAATCALIGITLAGVRMRRPLMIAGAVVLVLLNALALVIPVQAVDVPRITSTGPFGRLAVHPSAAMEIVSRWPDLPTTGDLVPGSLMLGQGTKEETNARLESLGADRAMLPDRSAAVIFNERDWQLLDRDRLLFGAPTVRPLLTAGIAATLLVVAEEQDARVFGDALMAIGVSTERVLSVRSPRTLDELDLNALRQHTMLVVYGRPWTDVARADAVLDEYLRASGFIFMDAAGRSGDQPLFGEANTLQASADQYRSQGDSQRFLNVSGFEGRVVGIDEFQFQNDRGWEQAALLVGAKRVLQFGQARAAGDVGIVAARAAWSGADLPARAASGDASAQAQLRSAITWMLTAAQIQITGNYGRPEGDVHTNETATSRFISPTHWRIEMKVATTGVLFKERYHPQWRAFDVAQNTLSEQQARTPLAIQPTADGHMYVTLPANARILDFVFEPHPLETASRGITAVAIFATAAITFFLVRRRA